ncbi:universal stress protein [Aeromicrobium sp. NPDC092404]|uniref:universal stress protein n=1 Tax=Aeromicrobium sp. NPDC092404 TaxID=3154976 RepID=UPI00341B01B1
MHVLIATDGSQMSLEAARHLMTFADPTSIDAVAVLAVVSPMAAVPFANEADPAREDIEDMSFRRAAERATLAIADEISAWGPSTTTHVRGGSPAGEIVKAARELGSGLIVMASRSSFTEAVLMGSVAHRVLNHAPCPVLVHRSPTRPLRG